MQRLSRVLGVLAIAFGLLTMKAGANVLFGDAGSHEGPVVPFVVWFNFLAAFGYVTAGVGLLLQRRFGERVAIGLAVATLAVFAMFAAHVASGGAYAGRTVGAMTIRAGFWIFAALVARTALRPRSEVAR